MGCVCSKSNENSNMDLDPTKISDIINKNNQSTPKKEGLNNVKFLRFCSIFKKQIIFLIIFS